MPTLFLCGDVMLGRGLDQLLPHPSPPALRERWVKDAREYLRLVEDLRGPLGRPVEPGYLWGEALPVLERIAPQARVINLETSITRSEAYWPGKEIHYRMSPENVAALTIARPDACVLANNHVLDFGRAGLLETLQALSGAGIQACGAGRERTEAQAPARIPLAEGGALLVFGLGTTGAGIPPDWAAGRDRPGVELLEAPLTEAAASEVASRIRAVKQPGDLAIASIHWGSNWGYQVTAGDRAFARRLIDEGVDLVHGHSSHHPRPLELHRGKLILYGCGDFINDYEGISGFEEFKSELRLMYFADLEPGTGALRGLRLVPLKTQRLTLQRASLADSQWLAGTLSSVSERFGVRLLAGADGELLLAGHSA